MKKPQIGDDLHFYSISPLAGGEPSAAKVVHIYEDGQVNLVVFDHFGNRNAYINVHLARGLKDCRAGQAIYPKHERPETAMDKPERPTKPTKVTKKKVVTKKKAVARGRGRNK